MHQKRNETAEIQDIHIELKSGNTNQFLDLKQSHSLEHAEN